MRKEFRHRTREIEDYFQFLSVTTCETDVLKTLKATGYLLLYNLVESTMTSVVSAIFDHIKTSNVCFEDASERIRIVALKNLKKRAAEKSNGRITVSSTDLLLAGFHADDLFSGNLDARKIRATAKAYGFSAQSTASGDLLLQVKTHRNDLSHGVKSFSEIGRETSLKDLDKAKEDVVAFLSDIVTNVEAFIDGKEYLSSIRELESTDLTSVTETSSYIKAG